MNTYAQKGMFLTALAGTLIFMSCSNTPAEQQEKVNDKLENVKQKADDMNAEAGAQFDRDRQAVVDDLTDLRNDIDNKLKETNDKLAKKDLKPSERKEAETMKAELEQEKAKVDAEMGRVTNATAETWNDVKVGANKTSEDVKSWWGRLKENVDKKTGSDHDNDGH
ncbi:MAG: hypothetical protein ABIQ75_09700 [Flavobacteriales bacterium]